MTARARQIVNQYLAIATSTEHPVDSFQGAVANLNALGFDAVPALAEALQNGDLRARVMAAWLIMKVAEQHRRAVNKRLKAAASQLLTHTLVRGCPDDQLLVCALLSGGGVPKNSVPILRGLLRDGDAMRRVMAAAALSGGELVDSEILAILVSGLRDNNAGLAVVAAGSLGRLGQRLPEAVQNLVAALPGAEARLQLKILESLKPLGTAARVAIPVLCELVSNPAISPYLRSEAAIVLGNISQGTNDALPVLLKAFRSEEFEILGGVVEGLSMCRDVPEDVVTRLAELLSAPDEKMRSSAALGLRALGERAAVALPALLERIGQEPSRQVSEALALTLAATGLETARPLTSLLREGDLRKIPVVTAALLHMKEAGAKAVAELLNEESDDNVRIVAVRILQDYGPKAAPAVPILAKMLDETTDDELAGYIVAALFVCGKAAREALPALIRCLVMRPEELAFWASQALSHFGAEAVAALTDALESAQGEDRRRIEEALAAMQGSRERQFPQLERLSNDQIELFMHVAEVLQDGRTMSWQDIGQLILDRIGKDRFDELPFGTSATSLRIKMAELAEILGTRLTSHRHGYRGGVLTAEGRAMLSDMKEYLAIKRRRAGEA